MALYKQSVDFLPKLSQKQVEEEYKVSKAGLYAAILPLLAAFIWVIAALTNASYKNELTNVKGQILGRQNQINEYQDTRKLQTELVLKIDMLKDLVLKNFYPQKFFDDVNDTIKSTGDAQASIYAYEREEDGGFVIKGKANSYLDLAKIMVVFDQKEEFNSVAIKSIYYDKTTLDVNFEISFEYASTNATGTG